MECKSTFNKHILFCFFQKSLFIYESQTLAIRTKGVYVNGSWEHRIENYRNQGHLKQL